MQEFLGINKAIQGEVVNNASKLTEINESMKKGGKKLKELEDDPTYSEEQKQLYREKLQDLETEKQARLEIIS